MSINPAATGSLEDELEQQISDDVVLAAAIADADDRVRLALLLAVYAGLRVSEIASLRLGNVGVCDILVTGDDGRRRCVPLHPVLADELAAEVQRRRDGTCGRGFGRGATTPDGWLFPSDTASAGHVTRQYLGKLISASIHDARSADGLVAVARPAGQYLYGRPTPDQLKSLTALTRDQQWHFAVEEHLTWFLAAGRARGTLKVHRSHLTAFAKSMLCRPWQVTEQHLVTYLASKASYRPETLKTVRSSIRSFYRWALDRGYVDADPSARLPAVRLPATTPNPVPDAIIRDTLTRATPREQVMILLAATAGLRCGEIARLHTDHVIQRADGVWLRVTGKGRVTREIPINPPLSTTLLELPAGFVFPGRLDGHLGEIYVGKLLRRLLPAGWSGHKLRHRYATATYARSRDLLAVQRLLGHSRPETTQRYTALPTDALRQSASNATL